MKVFDPVQNYRRFINGLIVLNLLIISLIVVDYTLPLEKIGGIIQSSSSLIVKGRGRTTDEFVVLNGEEIMLTGSRAYPGDYLEIERTPFLKQVRYYTLKKSRQAYFGGFYGVFCFLPIGLLIATIALYYNREGRGREKMIAFVILMLIPTLIVAL